MRKTENVELTVLCLVEDSDKILLQRMGKATHCRGHVEPEESFVDAVIREMKEETGMTVTADVERPTDGRVTTGEYRNWRNKNKD